MVTSLTFVVAAILFSGSDAMPTAELPTPLATSSAGAAVVETTIGGGEASYVHEISRRECADPIRPVFGRSRCH